MAGLSVSYFIQVMPIKKQLLNRTAKDVNINTKAVISLCFQTFVLSLSFILTSHLKRDLMVIDSYAGHNDGRCHMAS